MESDPVMRERHIDAMVAKLTDLDDAAGHEMVKAIAETSDILRDQGIVLAAHLTLLEQSPAITATMTATLAELPDGGVPLRELSDLRGAAQSLAEVLSAQNPGATVDVADLTNGPLVRLQQSEILTVSPEMAGTEHPVRIPCREVQYIKPTPDGEHLIVMSVNSPHLEQWAEFTQLAERIASTIGYQVATPRRSQ